MRDYRKIILEEAFEVFENEIHHYHFLRQVMEEQGLDIREVKSVVVRYNQAFQAVIPVALMAFADELEKEIPASEIVADQFGEKAKEIALQKLSEMFYPGKNLALGSAAHAELIAEAKNWANAPKVFAQ